MPQMLLIKLCVHQINVLIKLCVSEWNEIFVDQTDQIIACDDHDDYGDMES